MKIFVVFNFVCCSSNLVDHILQDIYKYMFSTPLSTALSFSLGLFLIFFGLRFKYISLSTLLFSFISATHTTLINYLEISKYASYLSLIISSKYLLGLSSFILSYLVLVLLNLLIYLTILILMIHIILLPGVHLSVVGIFVVLLFIFGVILFYFLEIIISLFFSLVGTFMLFLNFEFLFDRNLGLLKMYLDLMSGVLNENNVLLMSAHASVSLLSCTLQTMKSK